jgi:hypothetical protein
MCDFRVDLSGQDSTDRKIRAINLLVRLASRREVRPLRPSRVKITSSRESSPDNEHSSLKTEEVPLVLGRTQCIYCVGDGRLPYRYRMRTFKRVSHMMDHVEKVYLRHEPSAPSFVYRYPRCKHLGNFLTSLDDFKDHVKTVYGVKLRHRP